MGEVAYVVGNKNFYGVEIKKKGNVDVERIYKELIHWFGKNFYRFTEKGITSKTKFSVKEERLEWSSSREVDDYFKFYIEIEILIYRCIKEKAEIKLRFKGYLEKDYKNKFERKFGKKFGKFLRRIYEAYFILDKVDSMKGKIWSETNNLIDLAKKILNLATR